MNLKPYLKFIFAPWKFLTFLAGTLLLILASFYANDPTWDVGCSILMGVLTYLTAPWVFGTIYRSFKIRFSLISFLLALFFLYFSASASYDLYNFIKLGHIPESSFENAMISSVLYLLGGILWNLTSTKEKHLHFAFQNPTWPSLLEDKINNKILIFIALFALIFALIIYFSMG